MGILRFNRLSNQIYIILQHINIKTCHFKVDIKLNIALLTGQGDRIQNLVISGPQSLAIFSLNKDTILGGGRDVFQ